ncbi:MAG TPA: hypothetical protein PLF99_07250, partial [Tenuifilaceae bacterium]|nr:hypothetical protein [Tenuifilaceae bacterium]
EKEIERIGDFTYDEVDAVKRFEGTHPVYMNDLINGISWKVNIDETQIKMKFKDKILYIFEKLTGYRLFEYKNYIID